MTQETQTLSGGRLAQATGFVVMGFIVSRVLGLVRDSLLAAEFGAGTAFEAYATALQPPETILLVVAGGALGSAFIPTFTDYIARGEQEDAWRLTNAVLTLITLILIGVSLLAVVFAPQIVGWTIGRDFPPEKQALTVQLMRIMLMTPAIFGMSGLIMGLLNANQRFLLPAMAPGMYNLGIIGGVLFLSPSMGIFGAAWGAVIGALGHLIVQLPGVFAVRLPLRPRLDVAHPGVREVARLMGPRVLGLSVVQLNFWVNLTLASGMVEGSIAALRRAFVVLLLPQGIIAQSVAIAVFPTFSMQASQGDQEGLRRTLNQVLRAVLFLSIPATVGLVMLRLPIVRVIFERNEFTFADSRATAWALLFYGLGLASHALVEILTRAFYALHDTWTPVAVGGGAMALNVVLSLILIQVMGDPNSLVMGPFAGLALANTIATTLEGIILLALLGPRVGGYREHGLLIATLQAVVASMLMGAVLGLATPVLSMMGVLPGLLVMVAVGGAVFWGVAWALGSDEARLFTRFFLDKLPLPGRSQE